MNHKEQQFAGVRLQEIGRMLLGTNSGDPSRWFDLWMDGLSKARGGYPGTSVLPYECRFNLTSQLLIPNRHSVTGDPGIEHVRDHYGFWVTSVLKEEERLLYAIQNERAPGNKNGNGNFDCWLKRFFLKCNRFSNGINWHGAQNSGLERVVIHDAEAIALNIGMGSCRVGLTNVDIRNGASSEQASEAKERRGVGVRAKSVQGLYPRNTNFHHCKISWLLDGTHSVHGDGGFHENVNEVVRASRKSSDICLRGMRLERCGETPIDLRGAGPFIELSGSVRKSDTDVLYYIDQQGNEQKLCGDAKKGNAFHIGGRVARRLD